MGREMVETLMGRVSSRPAVLATISPRRADPAPEPDSLQNRLARAKRSFVTRRANLQEAVGLSRGRRPQAGDILLATVTEVSHHGRIELPDGRRAQLYAGDEIVVAYGARYAPDQFEAFVPEAFGPCSLVAGGGIAGALHARHARTRKPTAIDPIGILIGEDRKSLNVRQYALPPRAERASASHSVVAVVGTSMNAGKTTLAAAIIRGLSANGIRVGACKVTGTGSGGDLWSMIDAGAVAALDFTDAGFSTTAGADLKALNTSAHLLVSTLEDADVDVIVVEVADGLLQRETAALLDPSSSFAGRIDSLFLAAADSMGALASVEWLRARGLPLRALSGLITVSPLAAREAREATRCEVYPTRTFESPDFAAKLCLRSKDSCVPVSIVS